MKILYSKNQPLTEDKLYTFLNASSLSGDSTITVESIVGFAINKIILIGDFGNERSEVIKTHAVTSPTGTTITLASSLVFDHPSRTKVYILDYDQIEIAHASTILGDKTSLATISIQTGTLETQYSDTSQTSGYYFLRWKDSIGTTYSDYSDPIPFEGYGENTVGKAIQYALNRNKTDFTDLLSHDFCIEEINLCLDFMKGKLKRWSSLQEFDYDLGNVSLGVNSFTLPTSMWGYSNKAVASVRIGTESELVYKDKVDWEKELVGIPHTTLTSTESIGDISIALTSSRDFDDDGSVYILGQTITYTDNDRDTGVLSGIPASGTGSITSELASGSGVWSGVDTGNPDSYTIYENKLYFYPLVDSTLSGRNIWLDYWKEAPTIDSDGDTLDIARYNMVKYWLVWVIRSQINTNGLRSTQDTDYMMFSAMLSDAIRLQTSGRKSRIRPKINGITY